VSGELLGYKLIGLRQAIDSLELEFAQTAAEFAGTNEYDEQGSTSPIDWIRHTSFATRLTPTVMRPSRPSKSRTAAST
jgi:hypothetical protein